MKKDSRGFTLIELLFVAAFLALAAGLAAPSFSRSYRALSHGAAVDGLADALRLARQRAVMEGLRYRVAWEADRAAYAVLSAPGPETAPEPFSPLKERLGRRRTLPDGVSFQGDATEATFYPDGTATAADWTLASPEGAHRLRVDPVLGSVRVEWDEKK